MRLPAGSIAGRKEPLKPASGWVCPAGGAAVAVDRIEEVKDAICAMGSEEVYYWYSRCTSGNDRERTCRAFRIMVSKE